MCGEAGGHLLAAGRLAERRTVQHQSRAWHGVQDARPGGQHGIVQPHRAAEIAEGDEAIGERGQRRHVRHLRWRRVGEWNARQADQALAEQSVRAGGANSASARNASIADSPEL